MSEQIGSPVIHDDDDDDYDIPDKDSSGNSVLPIANIVSDTDNQEESPSTKLGNDHQEGALPDNSPHQVESPSQQLVADGDTHCYPRQPH